MSASSTLEGRAVTLIGSHAPLTFLDIRGEAAYVLGVDTDAVRARGNQSGKVLSEWLHAETEFEGLLYDSRLTGRACVAAYERAMAKIDASRARPLLAHADLSLARKYVRFL